jgi:Na+-driven multidrug efflux pump
MNRRSKTNIIVLVVVFLIFTVGYFLPRGDNLTATAMWVLLVAASIYVAVMWVVRWSRGEDLLRLDGYRKRFWRFALDEDDEPPSKPDSTSKSK